MDKKTLEKLGAEVTEIRVHVSRKVTDNNYGSYEVAIGETLSVGKASDVGELERQLFADLNNKVERATSAFKPEKPITIKNVPAPPEVAPSTPKSDTPAEPVRVALDEAGNEVEKVLVTSIKILFSEKGNKYGRIKSEKYPKSGIAVWARTLAEAPLEWDLDALDVGEYGVPDGLTALVKMGTYQGKPSPDSVVGWA